MSMSFNDTRAAVTHALTAVDKDHGKDLVVSDLGPDWVVYSDPDTVGDGSFKRSYTVSDGNVKFTSGPVKVTKQTTYNELAPKTLKEAAPAAREFARNQRAKPDARDL